MNIYCTCLVRDERDVLPHALTAAREWAAAIFITDNGSTDGTWEFLQEYAAAHPNVILAERDLGPYRPARRAEIVNEYGHCAGPDDWWCHLDADEIYVDDPRDVLLRARRRDSIVWSISAQFYFTDVDLQRYEADPSFYTSGWRPAHARYYRANWSEPRFVRHQPRRRWVGDWPANFRWLRSSRQRIRLKHYQYRSPPQMQRRLELRKAAPYGFSHEKGDGWLVGELRSEHQLWPHAEAESDLWRTRVLRASALHEEVPGTELIVDGAELPALPPALPVRVLRRLRRMWR